MNIDTERVITEIHLRPLLWDLNCELYKDRYAKLEAWKEVCQAIIDNYDTFSDTEQKMIEKQVQQRWKTARDAYVRCKALLKKTKSRSGGHKKKKYIYFDCMKFLDKKQVEDNEDSISASQYSLRTKTLSTDTEEDCKPNPSLKQNAVNDEKLIIASTPDVLNASETNQTHHSQKGQKNVQRRRKRITDDEHNFGKEMLKIFKENTKLMQNDDMSFFCSLLPITQTFTIQQKLLFRSEVLKKAIEISNDSTTCSSTVVPGTSNSSLQK